MLVHLFVIEVSSLLDQLSNEGNLLFLSASHDQNVNLWQLSGNGQLKVLHEYKGHARSVEALAVSPDSTKVSTTL